VISLSGRSKKTLASTSALAWVFAALLSLSVGLAATLSATTADAAFTRTINYQGKLADATGDLVDDGDYNMEFALYTAASGGSAIWTETRTSTDKVEVTNGLFSVMLGDVTSLDGVDFNQPLWLGVNIGGTTTPGWDGEMTPRKTLGAVPAALVAGKAYELDATNATSTNATSTRSYVSGGLAVGTTTSSAILAVQGSAIISGTTTVGAVFATGTSYFGGNVGIGTAAPASVLHVATSSTAFAPANLITLSNGYGAAMRSRIGTNGTIYEWNTNYNPETSTLDYGGGTTYSISMRAHDTNDFSGNYGMTFNAGTTGNAPSMAMKVTPAGNVLMYNSVGIGTTTPGSILAVQGSAIISGTTTVGALVATGTLTTTGSATIGGGVLIGAGPLLVNSSGGSALGVRHSSGSTFLNVEAADFYARTSNAGFTVGSGGGFAWSNSTDGLAGSVDSKIVRDSAGVLKVTDGSTGFGSLLAGGLGIGTTTPGATLVVQGNALISGTTTVAALVATGTLTTTGNVYLTSSGAAGSYLKSGYLQLQDGNKYIKYDSGTDGVTIGSWGPVKIAPTWGGGTIATFGGASNFNSSFFGNVGVGTTSPSVALAIQGGALVSGTTTVGALVSTSSIVSTGAATSTFANGLNLSAGCFAVAGVCLSGADGTFSTTSADFYIAASSTIPHAGNGAYGDLLMWDGAAWVPAATSSLGITGAADGDFSTTSATYYLANYGNIGIGTSTPGSTLSVEGEGFFSGLVSASGFRIDGYRALSANPTLRNWMVGEAGNTSISGEWNNLFGSGAGADLTSGDDNTFIGDNTGSGLTDSVGNTLIGSNANAGADSLTNATAIGYNAVVSASNALVLGGTGGSAVNVGIGTTTPGSILSIDGVANFTAATSTFYGSGGINIAEGCYAVAGVCISAGGGSGTVSSGTTGQFAYYDANGTSVVGTSTLFLNTDGKIGIGTITPGEKLDVNGNVQADAFIAISPTATSTFAGDLVVGSGTGDSIFQFGPDAQAWSMGYSETDSSFRIASSTFLGDADTLLALTKAGRLGVGTTTPGALFAVGGDALIGGVATVGSIVSTGAATSTFANGLNLASGCYAVAGVCLSSGGGGASFSTTSATYYLANYGSIGIGTSTPSALLAVHGSALIAGTTTVGALVSTSSIVATGAVGVGTTTTFAKLAVHGTPGGPANLFAIASSTLTATSTVLVVDRFGNLGLGTTTPSAVLAVKGNAYITGTTTAQSFFATGTSAFTGTTTFAASLGIGTTTPTSKLAIAGGNITQTASGNPTLKGTYDSTLASDVYVVGKYAYVADYTAGLRVVDVSNPASPTLLGTVDTGGFAAGVFVAGRYAYVVDANDGLNIVDVSSSTAPAVVGVYAGTNGDNVYVAGRYAYVAAGGSGLQIVDVSNPAAPTLVGSYSMTGAYDVYVVGEYAYVADQSDGFKIIDVSNPASTTLVKSIDTSGTAYGVYVSGNYAYVADATAGLKIYSLAGGPTLVGTYNTSGSAFGVTVAGRYAYVADDTGGLAVVDVSNPASPVPVGTYDTAGNAYSVFVVGKYAYVADANPGLQIIDVNGAEFPSIAAGSVSANVLSVLENANVGGDVFARGGLSVGSGAIFGGGVAVTGGKITQKAYSNPTLASTYDSDGAAEDVAVQGRYAYVADNNNGLVVLDTTIPTSPQVVGTLGGFTNAQGVAVAGSYAYVADYSEGLKIVDIRDPQLPGIAGRYDTAGNSEDVAVAGRYAYVADDSGGLLIFDASRPEDPVLVGTYSTANAAGVAVAGKYVYVAAGGDGLLIIDVSDPTSPTLVGSYDTDGEGYEVAVQGRYVYLADYGNGLVIFDVAVPSSPTPVSTYATPAALTGVAVAGDYAYLAASSGDVVVLDVADRAAPALAGSYTASGTAEDIAVAGGYVYVAYLGVGVRVLELSGASFPTLAAGTIDAAVLRVLNSLGVEGASSFTGDATFGGRLVAQGDSTFSGKVTVRGAEEGLGTGWTPHAWGSGLTASTLAYGDGKFVGVSQGSASVALSTDGGVSWGSQSGIAANGWIGAAYGNGTFVAVAYSGTNRVMTSPDGVTWTAQSAAEANSWFDVAYGNGTFVAVSANGTHRVMASSDGASWSALTAAEANQWVAVTYGNGTFVAVAVDGTHRVMTSSNGTSWSAQTAAEANTWYSVAYGEGTFVAVSGDGTNRVMTSPDGVTWTARSAPIAGWQTVSYGGGTFVATDHGGSVMTSPDGITWSVLPGFGFGNFVNDVQYGDYGGGTFVAAGSAYAFVSDGARTIEPTFEVTDGAGAPALLVGNGRIGIGTSTPLEKLHIAGGNVLVDARADSTTDWERVSSTTQGAIGSATMSIASTTAMAVYNGSLYVGTKKTDGAEVYRYDGGANWTKVTQAAGTISAETNASTTIDAVTAMTVYNGYLYIGTSEANRAQVYRYDGGTSWTSLNVAATPGKFLTQASIDGVTAMAVHNGALFIGTSEPAAGEVYRYDGGTTWAEINTTAGTFNTTAAQDTVSAMVTYNGYLYVGVSDSATFAQLLRWDGIESAAPFTRANPTAGTFETTASIDGISAMAVYNGALYIGTNEPTSGAEIYEYFGGTVVTGFQKVSGTAGTIGGGATTGINGVSSLSVYNGALYAGTSEVAKGEVYRFGGGSTWTKVTNSTAGSMSVSAPVTTGIDEVTTLQPFNDGLYGAVSDASGGEIYSYGANEGLSYALKFRAASDNAGAEVESAYNMGSITFSAENNVRSGADPRSGSFIFSHGISTAYGAYDVAEDYPTRDEDLAPGDLVSLDTREQGMVRRSVGKSDKDVIGVYSENPALRLTQQGDKIDGVPAVPIALAGRVPARVTLENGPIRIGDYLTASSEPGAAMRATRPGRVIGRALSAYDGADENVEAKVVVFIGAETIGWAEVADARAQVAAIAVEDGLTAFARGVRDAAADLAEAALTQSDNAALVVSNKLVSLSASIGKLFATDFTILPNGSVTVPEGENQVSGHAVLPAGATAVEVYTESARLTSKIFVTPTSPLTAPLVVTQKTEGVSFRVEVAAAQGADVTFDWLIVQTYAPAGAAGATTTAEASVVSVPDATTFNDGVGTTSIPTALDESTTTPAASAPEEEPNDVPDDQTTPPAAEGGGASPAEVPPAEATPPADTPPAEGDAPVTEAAPESEVPPADAGTPASGGTDSGSSDAAPSAPSAPAASSPAASAPTSGGSDSGSSSSDAGASGGASGDAGGGSTGDSGGGDSGSSSGDSGGGDSGGGSSDGGATAQ
jgi:hypothetical protein